MHIQSINTKDSYSSSFNARFRKAEVSSLISETKKNSKELSKLYTLLEFMDSLPAKNIRFIEHKPNVRYTYMRPDYKCDYFVKAEDCIMGHSNESKLKALENACVESILMIGRYARMSRSTYLNRLEKNQNVTEKDIEAFSLKQA